MVCGKCDTLLLRNSGRDFKMGFMKSQRRDVDGVGNVSPCSRKLGSASRLRLQCWKGLGKSSRLSGFSLAHLWKPAGQVPVI